MGSSLSPSPAVLFAFWQHKHYHESSEQSSDYPQNLLFRHIFFLRRSELRWCERFSYILLWYELQGDYYIPCLKLPEEEQQPIGIWGQRHLRYIKQNRKVLYLNLLTSGKLNGYLADLDKQADEMFSLLVKQMAESEGVTEQLKADNQMEWVDQMNNIRGRATEMVNTDLIYGW